MGEVRVDLGSGRIPITVSVGDGDAPARGCLSPNLTDNLALLPIQLSEVQCPICLWQHAARSGGFIRTEKIGQYYFGERWKGLLMGRSIPTHCGGWRFQIPTGKG